MNGKLSNKMASVRFAMKSSRSTRMSSPITEIRKAWAALSATTIPSNIQATHYWCNGEKGSTRMDE
jgi:hypothetical protein